MQKRRSTSRRDAIIEVAGTSLLVGLVSGFGPLGIVGYKAMGLGYIGASVIASVIATLGVVVVMLVLDARGERRIFGARDAGNDEGADGSSG